MKNQLPQIFIAPRSGEHSTKNFKKTVEGGYKKMELMEFLTDEDREALKNFEILMIWGNRPSLKSRWEKMQKEDWVFFYQNGYITYAGKLLYKTHNKTLADNLWGQEINEKGKLVSWEYVFFVSHLQEVNTPYKIMAELAGYKGAVVQGFLPYSEKGVKNILSKFGSIENFLKENLEKNKMSEKKVVINMKKNKNIENGEENDVMKDVEENGTIEDTEENETENFSPEETPVESVNFEVLNVLDEKTLSDQINPPSAQGIRSGDISIGDLLTSCEKREWVLPHFQRYFDWKKDKVKDLLDSVFNGLYIGLFLLWDVRKTQTKIGVQPISGVNDSGDVDNTDYIILDGQQRITALYYAFKAPEIKDDPVRAYFFLNLFTLLGGGSKTYESEDLIFSQKGKMTQEQTFEKGLFPLYEMTNHEKWAYDFSEFLREKRGFEEKQAKLIYRAILGCFRRVWGNFKIPFVYLEKSVSLNQAATIFERINTKGKVLTVFDLATAKMYRHGIELRSLWDETKKVNGKYPYIAKYSKKIDKMPIFLLESIALFYTKSSSCNRSDILNLYEEITGVEKLSFVQCWEDSVFYLEEALKKLERFRDGFGVKDEKNIPYEATIPIIASLLHFIAVSGNQSKDNTKLENWYWSVVFSDWFIQGSQGKKTTDYKEVREWFSDDAQLPKVVERARNNVQNIDLKKTQKNSALLRGVMSLIALKGANDFATGQPLEGARQNNRDHIYPRKDSTGYSKNLNSVLNLTWLSEPTNKAIKSGLKPSKYIEKFIREKHGGDEKALMRVLETHFIDKIAYEAMKKDDAGFDNFIEHREELIKEEIRRKIGGASEIEIKINDTPERLVDEVEKKIRSLIDKTLTEKRVDYWNEFIPVGVKDSVVEKISAHTRKHPADENKKWSPIEMLSFCDVTDYLPIITMRTNWADFEKYFQSKANVEKHFSSLSEYRNCIKHGRKMDNVIRKNGEAALEWIDSVINKS